MTDLEIQRLDLSGSQWQLHFTSPVDHREHSIPAQVPGNVLEDLHRGGLIGDPYWNCNSVTLRPWEFVDWRYSTVFTVPALQPGLRLQLHFGGIDTIAAVYVNGALAGEAKDMFIAYDFDVTDLVRAGENTLEVRIASSVNYARQFHRPPFATALPYNYEALYIRRARHTYGWDIAPRLVGAGLWRGVELRWLPPTRWGKTYLYTWEVQSNGTARMLLDWSFETDAPILDGYEIRLALSCGDSRHEERFPVHFVTGTHRFDFPGARLWWPLGYGEPALYDATLELLRDGATVATRRFRTGIRDITLQRTETLAEDGSGQFQFLVNNTPVFVKGSNWVPSDALHGERPERVPAALALFRELGCNMVRCWGGNIYEGDDFFDLCDEYGLMVWQDFMGACEIPPQDEWYLQLLAQEQQAVVEALRQHPSLALWCGDNEGDESFFYSPAQRRRMPSSNRVSREICRRSVELHDPARDYLPCSPYLADELKRRNARYRSPEQHLWGPRDNHKNPFYRQNLAIFASEIGYHGMPAASSVRQFLPEESWNGREGDPGWNCHAAQPFGEPNGAYTYRTRLMLNQVDGCFGMVPPDLETLVAASQIVQAEAMKFFVESFRQAKWRRTGIIWWNVIDCWPQFSDAVVDYYYRRKLAYHYLRNVQQPLLLSFAEPAGWGLDLVASNDSLQPAAGTYRAYDLDSGQELAAGTFQVPANAAAVVEHVRVSQGRPRMLVLEWECGGQRGFNHYALNFPPGDLQQYLGWLDELNRRFYHLPLLFQ